MVSLMHCAGCGLSFSSANQIAVLLNTDEASVPDTPEHLLPCHSGHCLSHVIAQQGATVATPTDPLKAPLFAEERSQRSLAGLPLFKPPRA
jgi:hypothetical protein